MSWSSYVEPGKVASFVVCVKPSTAVRIAESADVSAMSYSIAVGMQEKHVCISFLRRQKEECHSEHNKEDCCVDRKRKDAHRESDREDWNIHAGRFEGFDRSSHHKTSIRYGVILSSGCDQRCPYPSISSCNPRTRSTTATRSPGGCCRRPAATATAYRRTRASPLSCAAGTARDCNGP